MHCKNKRLCYEGIGTTSNLQLKNTCFVTVLYNVIDFEIPTENSHIQTFIFYILQIDKGLVLNFSDWFWVTKHVDVIFKSHLILQL